MRAAAAVWRLLAMAAVTAPAAAGLRGLAVR